MPGPQWRDPIAPEPAAPRQPMHQHEGSARCIGSGRLIRYVQHTAGGIEQGHGAPSEPGPGAVGPALTAQVVSGWPKYALRTASLPARSSARPEKITSPKSSAVTVS